jgi:hypothetical protein
MDKLNQKLERLERDIFERDQIIEEFVNLFSTEMDCSEYFIEKFTIY